VGGRVGEKARGRIRRDREDGRELAGSQPPATPGQFRLQRFLLHGLRSGTRVAEKEEEGKSRASRRLRVICPEAPRGIIARNDLRGAAESSILELVRVVHGELQRGAVLIVFS